MHSPMTRRLSHPPPLFHAATAILHYSASYVMQYNTVYGGCSVEQGVGVGWRRIVSLAFQELFGDGSWKTRGKKWIFSSTSNGEALAMIVNIYHWCKLSESRCNNKQLSKQKQLCQAIKVQLITVTNCVACTSITVDLPCAYHLRANHLKSLDVSGTSKTAVTAALFACTNSW